MNTNGPGGCGHSSGALTKTRSGGNKARRALRNKIKLNSEGLVDIQESEASSTMLEQHE
jgi:hypothetical protein